jgi:hypothetical protein
MPKVLFSLTENSDDIRSAEKAFQLTVENVSNNLIELIEISPHIPEEVDFQETKHRTIMELGIQHRLLCQDLTLLFNDEIYFSSEKIRKEREEIIKQLFDEILNRITSPVGLLRFYIRILLKPKWLKQISKHWLDRYHASYISIDRYELAKDMFDKFIKSDDNDSSKQKLFSIKLEQMLNIENELQSRGTSTALSVIEPESIFTEDYILKFPRSFSNPSKYTISFEIVYRESGTDNRVKNRVSESVEISPSPIVLSLISMLSGVMGAFSVNLVSNLKKSVGSFSINSLLNSFNVGNLILGAVLALVVFNVYEYFGSSKFRADIKPGWRSALLVGFLCGMFNDNFLRMLEAFLGFK